MWMEDTRSVVPVLPPISRTVGSPSRYTPMLTSHRSRPLHLEQHSQGDMETILHSESSGDRYEQLASSKELVVKVTELSTELSRMKAVLGHLEAERTSQDVWLKESFGHVRDQLSWLSKKTDESINNLAKKMEQLEHRTATEYAQLTAAVEQGKKGAWQHSDKMKDLLEEQISNLNQVFQKEHDSQMKYITQLNNKLCGQLGDMQGQLESMKKSSEKQEVKYVSQVSGLSSSLSEVARGCKLSKEELSSVLNAEIRTRQTEVASAQSQYQKLHGLCRSSIGSVREGLLSLEERFAADKKEAQSLRDKLLQECEGMSHRMQADMSARITALHDHISSVSSTHNLAADSVKKDDHVTSPTSHVTSTEEERKMKEANEDSDRTRQPATDGKLPTEGVLMSDTMKPLHKELERQSSQLNSLASSLNDLQFWVVGALQRETGERSHSVFELRKEVSNLQTQLSMALTTLNLPYSAQNSGNANTAQYYQLHVRVPHPPPQPAHFTADQDANFANQSHHVNDEHNGLVSATLDDAMIPERPVGVTTTAHSPFPELGKRRGQPYSSDEESEITGTELESETDGVLTERRNKYDESAVLPQSPLLQHQMATVYTTSDPLETSLESHSLLSSTSPGVTDQLQHQVPEGDRSRHSPGLQYVQQDDDDLETRGRFTSASATPNSQQKVLILDRTRQAELDSPGEDQESEKEELFKPEEDPSGGNETPLASEPASSS